MIEVIEGTAVYSDENGTLIDCYVLVDGEEMPYTAKAGDESTSYVWDIITSGLAGSISTYVPPYPKPEYFPFLKPYQFWTVMRATGHESDLRNWVSSLNDEQSPNYDPVAWAYASSVIDYSLEYRREHSLVEAAREVMGVTEEQLDDLWRYASTL